MHLKYGFISVDDHVQETPNLWISRVQKKFADRVPRLVAAKDGSEQWFLDGQMLLDGHTARAGALMADRNEELKRWADVPAPAFTPAERLKAFERLETLVTANRRNASRRTWPRRRISTNPR